MSWSDAGTVINDIVLTQTENSYDADGNVLLTTTRDRADSAIGTGDLAPGSDPAAAGYAHVVGRDLFYNNSYFDGNNTAINSSDDSAIATDKSALLPGQQSSFANYSSYDKGINGIMIDISGLPSGATLTASDFIFTVGNGPGTSAKGVVATPATWSAAPSPSAISVRTGAGVGGSDRVEITWTDGSIAGNPGEWLQVAVKPDANTGLAGTDVFYFGAAEGETGNSTSDATVNATDEILTRYNHANPAGITDVYDFNRDGVVDATDELVPRNNGTTVSTRLKLFFMPVQARSTYVADYYDAADRLTTDVDAGTNGGNAYTYPIIADSPSDTKLVTSYGYVADNMQVLSITGAPSGGSFTLTFGGQTTSGLAYNATASAVQSALVALTSIGSGNASVYGADGGPYTIRFIGSMAGTSEAAITTHASFTGGTSPAATDGVIVPGGDAGMVQSTIDPRGTISRTDYDLMGRTIDTVGNYVDGVPSTSGTDDQVTRYTYNGDSDVLSQTAIMPAGTPSQTTAYIYGVGVSGGLFSNDLVAGVQYPDPSTGFASSSAANDISYAYNNLGDIVTAVDQNGTTHAFSYDPLDRLTLDAVTTLGTGVDGSIRAIGYSYNTQELPFNQTSYSDAAATTVVNEVEDVYNGLGQLTTQYQEHAGAVNTSTSLSTQYTYSSIPTGSRLTSMTYPNGRILDYTYGSSGSLNDVISRVATLTDDNTGAADATYTYLGLDTIVDQAFGNSVSLNYINTTISSGGLALLNTDGGDQYTGLDRFGRLIDQNYSTSSATTDRFQYGYDRSGNVLYKKNLVSSSFSELYHANSGATNDNNTAYDRLDRVINFRRGTLSASGNNGTGALDTVTTLNTTTGVSGNSQTWALDTVGNQTSVSTDGTVVTRASNSQNEITTVGSSTLTSDNNGNMTTDQSGNTLQYDAWNRLVTFKNSGGTTLASYSYDANGWRIQETHSGTTTDVYFTAAGQVIEERQSGTVTNQYVWNIDYVNDLLLRDDNSTSGSLGKSGSGLGRRLYVQHDANFNVTALVNTSGTVQERFIQDPYGNNLIVLTASWVATSDSYGWTYFFQGGRYDAATGLFHFGARDYSASLGTWGEKDIAYLDGQNLYDAFSSNTLRFTDPSGRAPQDQHYGLPRQFWQWYHRQIKRKGDPDLTQEEAEDYYDDWVTEGKPNAEGKPTEDTENNREFPGEIKLKLPWENYPGSQPQPAPNTPWWIPRFPIPTGAWSGGGAITRAKPCS